jgi:hypothetical protein
MKEFFLKYRTQVSILLLAIIAIILVGTKSDTSEFIEKVIESDISSATQITCTYPQVLNASYYDSEISHSLPDPETNPIIFTFTDFFDTQIGNLSFIDATQTITNVEVIKLIDNEEKMVFLEGTGDNYLTVHTIYKTEGIATYTKNVNIFGVLSGSLAMGSCTGY